MIRTLLVLVFLLGSVAIPAPTVEAQSKAENTEEPELPPGLEPLEPAPLETAPLEAPASDEPELPAGLEPQGLPDEPALPPGLGGDPSESQPKSSDKPSWRDALRLAWEARFGSRLSDDAAQDEDLTLLESRLQLEAGKPWKRSALDVRVDLLVDGLDDGLEVDLRQLRWTVRLHDSVDVQIGRQILTWGTGDLLFINDLFPKDWQAFLLGRKLEYLKAPSDAVRLGWFNPRLNVELVYTPRFDPDRYLTGERLSFFDPAAGGLRGSDRPVQTNRPDAWLEDDEVAVRLSRDVGSYELAFYGYRGFWKSPAGFDPTTGNATFPRLDVTGASIRGPWGRGIATFELGYYDSLDDPEGDDPTVANSELRGLMAYELELGRDFTGGLQLYAEHLLDEEAYRRTQPANVPLRDATRTLITVRLTRLLRNQTVRLSLFTFYSPSDEDGYLRPRFEIDFTDRSSFEVGGNLFFGRRDHTFFGQFEHNTSVFTAWRYTR